MIKSMTAFANSDLNTLGVESDEISINWEIRSVNHRYLDTSVYLPDGFMHLENRLKDLLKKKLGRGKVDAKLVYQLENDQNQFDLQIDAEVVKGLFNAQNAIASIAESASATHTSLSLSRAENIKELVLEVRKRRPLVIQALREKVLKKIHDLDIEVDNNRLEQELVIQAQRLDVDEELDRLDSHIEELSSVLTRNEPIGRRLDFLMQELNREANTLGSKANDAKTTKISVELKVLIEQMREQVMNIE